MTDLLGIGASGVRAYQAALDVTGDNVANADTVGFARRKISLATGAAGSGDPLSLQRGYGAGVTTAGVTRSVDALKTAAARVASGDSARFSTRSDWLTRLQGVLSGADAGARIGGFFDAATDLAAAPTSIAARTIFLDRADQAANGLSGLGTSLRQLGNDIAVATDSVSSEVNAITASLARVNDELRRTPPGGGAANALLDSRDTLLSDLADRVRISVTEGARGTVTVRIGTDAAAAVLVPAKGDAVRIGVRDGAWGGVGAGAELVLDPTHAATVLRLPASGTLTGLIEAARQVRKVAADVDDVATRLAGAVNAWSAQGTDARGDPGTALFATQSLDVTPGKANAGAAPVDVTMVDGAVPAPGGYTLLRDAGGWTLSRNDGSATTTGPGTLTLDGVSVRPGDGARDGDSYALAVTGGAIGLALRPIGAARIAVAARFIGDTAATNKGDGRIDVTLDPLAAGFTTAVGYELKVTAPGVGEVRDPGGALLATVVLDGSRIAGAGFAFTLTGNAVVGDSFRILPTAAGSSDNGNMLALSAVRDTAGPGGTIEDALDATIAAGGATLAETNRLAQAALAVRADTASAADAVTGVDLNREAAELTRLQVAYRANAQVIAAARDMFDTIFQLSR